MRVRMPRVRFTVRRMMIAVAILILIASTAVKVERRRSAAKVVEVEQRRDRYHRLAAFYRRKELNPQPRYISITMEELDSLSKRAPRLKPYYAALKEKYLFAEQHPSLPVEPDPREPE